MLHGCSVVELRQYTLHDGTRDRLIHLFEDEFIEFRNSRNPRYRSIPGILKTPIVSYGCAAFPTWTNAAACFRLL